MTSFLRIGLGLALIIALVVAAQWVDPSPPGDRARDLVELPDIQAKLERENERSVVLDQHLKESLARVEEKNRVAAELAAGRLTLPAAAARFRELLGAYPPAWDYLRLYGQGRTDEERVWRYVIFWTRNVLRKDPGKASAVAHRLEEELDDYLRQGRLCAAGSARRSDHHGSAQQ